MCVVASPFSPPPLEVYNMVGEESTVPMENVFFKSPIEYFIMNSELTLHYNRPSSYQLLLQSNLVIDTILFHLGELYLDLAQVFCFFCFSLKWLENYMPETTSLNT